jgi:hypothetical protein
MAVSFPAKKTVAITNHHSSSLLTAPPSTITNQLATIDPFSHLHQSLCI